MITRIEELISEYSVRNKKSEDIPVYSVTNDRGFCTGYFSKEVASKDKSTYKIVPRGYFAFNPSRINVGSVDWQNCEDRVIVSPLYVVFSISEQLDQQYFLHYLKSDIMLNYIKEYATGSVRDNLKLSDLGKLPVNLRPLDEQRRIVAVLDKVSDLIAKRRQQLEKLDLLVKARFVEMFGTLLHPTKEFKYDVLKNLCKKITDGKHGGCVPQQGTKRYFIGAKEIFDDAVHYETAPEINIEDFEKDYKRCNLEIGDFLIVNTGATIGKSAIACDPKTEYTLLQKSVALLKVKSELLNVIFLKYCYRVNDSMYKVESASAQPNLLLSKINTTSIYVPPIDLQNQFANFVNQTEKTKTAVKESLEKLETLKKALMQEYFG